MAASRGSNSTRSGPGSAAPKALNYRAPGAKASRRGATAETWTSFNTLGHTSMTFMITSIVSRSRQLIFALSLVAVANAACSKEQPTKEQLLSRAKDAFAAEQYDKAEKEYRECFRLAPDDPAALRQLGIIYLDQGQIPQAYPLLKKSAELQPDDPEIQLKLGQIFLAIGEHAQARDVALQVLEKQPGQEQALLLLVDASRKRRRY